MSAQSEFRLPQGADVLRQMLKSLSPDELEAFIAWQADRDRWIEDYLSNLDQQVYAAQRTGSDFTSVANTETTVVTLGPQPYLAGETYEIRAMVTVHGSVAASVGAALNSAFVAGTRMLARILNVTDTLRENICDLYPILAGQGTTYSAIYVYKPDQDRVVEFAITAQNANATGTLTIDGSPPAATGGVPALITANRVGAN